MRCIGAAIDARGRQQQEGLEPQLGEAAGDEADMCLRGVDRAAAEVASQADAAEDMAAGLARRKQCGERGPGDRVNQVILALERGDECRADEAAGAEDHER